MDNVQKAGDSGRYTAPSECLGFLLLVACFISKIQRRLPGLQEQRAFGCEVHSCGAEMKLTLLRQRQRSFQSEA
jgi:hypothetical protein